MSVAYSLSNNPPAPRHTRNWREASRREPCPICRHADWCRVFADGAWECMRTPGDHPCRSGGWMYWPDGRPDDWRERIVALPPRPPRPTADLVLVDRAYRALLGACPLSDDDRAGLHARGLSDEETAGTFGTLPGDARARSRLVAIVADAIGCDPAGVIPGFLRTAQGRTELVSMPGLLVAGWTADGLLGSLQVRVKDPGKGGKYKHLSAGDADGSIGADGLFVNVARPLRPVSTTRVILTEGYIKGRIIANRLGRITLAVAGTNSTAKVVDTIAALGDVEEVWMAYDRDSATNPHVAAAEAKIVRELSAAGYGVKQLDWPAEYGKGLDDALQAGVVPVAMAHPALAQSRQPDEPDETPPSDIGRRLTRLQAERDSLSISQQASRRIQRNTRLPARAMAAVVTGVFAQAASACAPAGDYQGRVPIGFVSVPVRELAFDAGTTDGNAGKQLKDIEAAGLIRRKTIREALPAGQVNPETGEVVAKANFYNKHFLAIAGHEHEPITPELVRELTDRMATYDPGVKERRGGKRIPRCPKHPDAEVRRHWTAYCSVCKDKLDGDDDPVPAMLLEPLRSEEQSLLVRNHEDDGGHEADAPDNQSLLFRTEAPKPIKQQTPRVRDSHGIRPITHEVHQSAAAVDQSLVVRRQRAYADLAVVHERAASQPADRDDVAELAQSPPLTLFPLPDPGCQECGAAIGSGQTYCRSCDPRTA